MRELKTILFLLIFVSFFVFIGCDEDEDSNPTSPSSVYPGAADQIQNMLDGSIAEFQVAGGLVGVKLVGRNDIWIGTTGKANLNFDVDIEWDDRFKIGSITKTYVATVVLQLVDADSIELDSAIQKYLPDSIAAMIPVHPDTIMTLRSVLNHTCGLINFNHTPEFQMVQQASYGSMVWTAVQLLSLTTDSLTHKPGTAWNYCNTGYVYLQLMVEHLTGNSLKHELDTRVFGPVGLPATEYCELENPPDIVNGYMDFDRNGVLDIWNDATAVSPTVAMAAGAMVSNAPDMLKWLDALIDGDLLSAATQVERLKTVPVAPGAPLAFGLGIVDENPTPGDNQPVLGHIGGIDGFSASLFKDKLGNNIVVLVNSSAPVASLIPARAFGNPADEILMRTIEILAGTKPTSVQSGQSMDFNSVKAYYQGCQTH